MNAQPLVEVKYRQHLAKSGNPLVKTFTGAKLGECTSEKEYTGCSLSGV